MAGNNRIAADEMPTMRQLAHTSEQPLGIEQAHIPPDLEADGRIAQSKMTKHKIDIAKLLRHIPQDGYYTRLMDYAWELTDYELQRDFLMQTEQEIKRVAGNEDNTSGFRHFSKADIDKLYELVLLRGHLLDHLLQPTQMEVKRLSRQNDRLFKLTQEVYAETRKAWVMLRNTPYKVDDTHAYEVEGNLLFKYGKDAVAKLENDGYYGSDFPYMIHLLSDIVDKEYDALYLKPIADAEGYFYDGDNDMTDGLLVNTLDDGQSWNEGVLRNHAFDDIIICHAIHALNDHQPYSIPDILRMDNFVIDIRLKYENEVCDGREGL